MGIYRIFWILLIAICLTEHAVTPAQITPQEPRTSVLPNDVKRQIDKLSSSDPAVRAAGACALGKIGKDAELAIPALIGLLHDGSRIEPKQVCYREHFTETNVESEFEGLKEPSPGEAAVQALISLGESSVEPLMAALKNTQWRTRKNAAWALAQIRDPRSLGPLIEALKDDTWQVRAYAAAALGEQRDERTIRPLISALRDEKAAVRWFAAASLGQSRDIRAVNPLIQALKDQHPRTRAFAAASLGQIRDGRTVQPLIDALKDESPQVRMYAAASLGQQRDVRARTALNDALKDESHQVRYYARIALDQFSK